MSTHPLDDFGLSLYQELAMRTAKVFPTMEQGIVHAALGVTGEAGELADCVKRTVIYGKMFDRENFLEEVGDTLWYLALACHEVGADLRHVARDNLDKLKKRYPEKYYDADALARADKAALEQQDPLRVQQQQGNNDGDY